LASRREKGRGLADRVFDGLRRPAELALRLAVGDDVAFAFSSALGRQKHCPGGVFDADHLAE
jgi:hypothetical protein